jgi:hypothetical protein
MTICSLNIKGRIGLCIYCWIQIHCSARIFALFFTIVPITVLIGFVLFTEPDLARPQKHIFQLVRASLFGTCESISIWMKTYRGLTTSLCRTKQRVYWIHNDSIAKSKSSCTWLIWRRRNRSSWNDSRGGTYRSWIYICSLSLFTDEWWVMTEKLQRGQQIGLPGLQMPLKRFYVLVWSTILYYLRR